MPRDLYNEFEYDVALSYAPEGRSTAETLADLLIAKHITVFHDSLEAGSVPGGDMLLHLAEIFRAKARYCLMLVSRSYPLERWTEAERTFAKEHALRDANEYFLPIRLDDHEVPGLTETAAYRDLHQQSLESLADLLEEKLKQTKGRSSGPPPESHDLRSGNVSSKRRT